MSDDPGRVASGTAPLPDPFAVVSRSWRLVVLFALVAGALGAVFADGQQPTYSSSAVVVVEDARSRLFDRPSTDIERYVASQAAVIGSEPVAAAASKALARQGEDVELTPSELLDGLTVQVAEDADVINIRLRADDATTAQAGASAIARAYAELVASSIQADLGAARSSLDEEIDQTRAALDANRQEIAALRSPATSEIDDVVAATSDRLTSQTGDAAADAAEAAGVAADLSARRELSEFEERAPELAAALQTQDDLEVVLTRLNDRRAVLAADAALVGSGVAFATEAAPGRPNRFSTPAAVLLAAFLGAGLGVALAYLLASWQIAIPWLAERPVAAVAAPSRSRGERDDDRALRHRADDVRAHRPRVHDDPPGTRQPTRDRSDDDTGDDDTADDDALDDAADDDALEDALDDAADDAETPAEEGTGPTIVLARAPMPESVPLLGTIITDGDNPAVMSDGTLAAMTSALDLARARAVTAPVVTAVGTVSTRELAAARDLATRLCGATATDRRILRIELLDPAPKGAARKRRPKQPEEHVVQVTEGGSVVDVVRVWMTSDTVAPVDPSWVHPEEYDEVVLVLHLGEGHVEQTLTMLAPDLAVLVVDPNTDDELVASSWRALHAAGADVMGRVITANSAAEPDD